MTSGGRLLSIPTHVELLEAIGQRLAFGAAGGHSVEAGLAPAPVGVPTNDSYVGYSATFELSAGVLLPQNVYHIGSPGGGAWAGCVPVARVTDDECVPCAARF